MRKLRLREVRNLPKVPPRRRKSQISGRGLVNTKDKASPSQFRAFPPRGHKYAFSLFNIITPPSSSGKRGPKSTFNLDESCCTRNSFLEQANGLPLSVNLHSAKRIYNEDFGTLRHYFPCKSWTI